MAADETYLDLTVGRLALALAAQHVIFVRQDVKALGQFDPPRS